MDLAEALVKATRVIDIDVSKKLKALAFNWNRDGKWDIFVYIDNKLEKITRGPNSYFEPSFSNRSDMIAYVYDKDGNENFQVVVRNMDGDKEEEIAKDPNHYHLSPSFSLDDSLIAFISNRSGKPMQLHVYEDGSVRELTNQEVVSDYRWVSNKEIVYVRGFYDTQVRLINIDSGEDRLLLYFKGCETWIGDVDKRKFLFTSNPEGWFNVGEYDLDRGEWRWLVKSSYEKYDPKYCPDGIAYIEFAEGNHSLIKIVGGNRSVVAEGVVDFDFMDNKAVYIVSKSTQPDSLFVDGRPYVDTLPEELRGILIEPEAVYYDTFDGRKVNALLYMPKEWNKALVVYIHGGPDAYVSDEWIPTVQLLATKGYAVLAPNYRGSTGFGRVFGHLNDKDLGGGDLRDVVHACLYAKRLGPERVFALGASYGGYLTALALVKFPDIWDGGVAIAGFYNWETETRNEADYLQYYDRIKMDPSLFYDRSPINFLDNLKAPILFIHGKNDPRCPASEMEMIVERLKSLGKEFEIKVYHDEGHSIRRDSNRIDMYRLILKFLDSLTSRPKY